jgi:hypothetical protein
MKKCRVCNQEFDLDFFYTRKGSVDGHHHLCKTCLKEANADYRTSNPDRIKKKDSQYYLANKLAMQESHKNWKQMNPSYFNNYYHRVRKLKNAEKRRQENGSNSKSSRSHMGSTNPRI